MVFFRRYLLVLGFSAVFSGVGQWAVAESVTNNIEEVEVTADRVSEGYRAASNSTATPFNLSLMETPQSVSVVTRVQMDDFGLNTVNDVLRYTTGIVVEAVETDRTYYMARGFEVTNFQLDGVGVPLPYGVADGDFDTAIYDRVEVVRGANGLMAGAGDPSATVNMIRKRPTSSFGGNIKASAGSWDNYRLEADVSGPFSDGARGRMVLATQDSGSYLDRYGIEKNVAFGVAEFDLGERSWLRTGVSYQKSAADSPMWGALTLVFSDGSSAQWDESTSTSADWAFWDNEEIHYFAQ